MLKTEAKVRCSSPVTRRRRKPLARWSATSGRRLPQGGRIIVFDNNCTDPDGGARSRSEAGAIVCREKRQGKGYVVASMFEKIDADIYVMVDGDDTYDAKAVDFLLEPILKGDADMTVASRLDTFANKSFRNFHILGNKLVCGIINWMFKSDIHDIFSGYRAFTREAAKLIPITAVGFDVETELTLQALYQGLVIKEVQAAYGTRPEGSFSKFKTGSDGWLVLFKLFMMIKSCMPLTFFGGLAVVFMVTGLLVGTRPVVEYAKIEHYVHAVPSAILASSLVILSFASLGLGLILNSVNLRKCWKWRKVDPANGTSRDASASNKVSDDEPQIRALNFLARFERSREFQATIWRARSEEEGWRFRCIKLTRLSLRNARGRWTSSAHLISSQTGRQGTLMKRRFFPCASASPSRMERKVQPCSCAR